MKRTRDEKTDQFASRHFFPGISTAPVMRNQALFRNYNQSVEPANKAIIRNNLHLLTGDQSFNARSLLSFCTFGGQHRQNRPNFVGRDHQSSQRIDMNTITSGIRLFVSNPKFLPNPKFLQPCLRSVFSNHARSNQINQFHQIPSTAWQFQESQRNVRLMHQNVHQRGASTLQTKNRGCKTICSLAKNNVSMRRKWQSLPESAQCHPYEFAFSLVTYNVLSDSLLCENMYLYEDCNKDDLRWESRKVKLLAELLGYDAEVLCLQEVEACHYEDWFFPKLQEAGYLGVFIQRTGGKPDGCAIFYRHAKFTLVCHKLVQYFTPKVKLLDKDNVGIILLLKAKQPDCKTEEQFICVANTHLLFNKRRGDIKLAQIAYLFAEINELSLLTKDDHSKTHCPIILCGDLNSLPYSPLYNFLITGQLEYCTRCPAALSGQLPPSETRYGPSTRRIQPPLLPWEFGVSADCQWREDKPEGCSTRTQDKQTFRLQEATTCRTQQRKNAEDWNDHHESIQPNRNTKGTCAYMESDLQQTNFSSNIDDRRVNKDSEQQSNSARNEFSKDFSGQLRRTENISLNVSSNRDVTFEMKRDAILTNPCNRMRESDKNVNISSIADGTTFFKQTKSNPSKIAEKSERNSEVIDLTSDMESPDPCNRVSNSKRENIPNVSKDTRLPARVTSNPKRIVDKSETHREIVDLTNNTVSPDPCNSVSYSYRNGMADRFRETRLFTETKSKPDRIVDKSGRTSEFINLTGDTESPSPHGAAPETSRFDICDRDRDTNRSNTSRRAWEQHSDTLVPTTSTSHADMQTEKKKYNNNGTIYIPWHLKSVYTHRFRDGSPEVTTCHSKACCNVDYIFYSTGTRDGQPRGHVQTGKLTLLGRLELLRKSDITSMRVLPNDTFPSDHLSLKARFKLT